MIMKQARARRIQCLALGQSVRCLKARVVVMVVVVRRSFSGAGRMPTRTRGGSSRELSLRSSNAAGAGTFFSSSENDLLSWMTEYFTNMYVVYYFIFVLAPASRSFYHTCRSITMRSLTSSLTMPPQRRMLRKEEAPPHEERKVTVSVGGAAMG